MPNPPMYDSVRAIGTFRPKFIPGQGRVFSDELTVLGTGFWLKDEKVLITCAHVVQNVLSAPLELAGLLVVGKTGSYRRAVIASADVEHDLAVLVLVQDNGQPVQGDELSAEASSGLVITTQYPDVATAVGYAGFPLGNQLLNSLHSPTYAEGVVGIQQRQTGRRKEIQISGPIAGGFSGSPIVKVGTNELVAVVSSGPGSQGNIFMGVSWEHVRAIAALANS
jgi:hypothetical protein